jgi:hypothetical protein
MRYYEIVTEMQAYHGSDHHFEEFSSEHIGTGKGYQTFGWGIYLTREKTVARRYRSPTKGGKIYVVEMPDVHELLDWNSAQQSREVQSALSKLNYLQLARKMIDLELTTASYADIPNYTGEDIYGVFVEDCYETTRQLPLPEGRGLFLTQIGWKQ